MALRPPRATARPATTVLWEANHPRLTYARLETTVKPFNLHLSLAQATIKIFLGKALANSAPEATSARPHLFLYVELRSTALMDSWIPLLVLKESSLYF